ncbi:MAG TPA: glycosyltransferase family 1 protein [Gemmatimonadales bacterium]|nr:glycosyltransferase family 1 protein [Gemmatimonadales bacterium]
MAVPAGAPCRLGFDAIRALHNGTGLGNYARHLLAGLAEAAPERELHLYTPRQADPRFARVAEMVAGHTHAPDSPWRMPVARNLWRTFRLGRDAARDGIELYHGLTQELPRDLPETGIKSVLTVPDLLYVTRPELFGAIDRQSYRWRYRWSVQHADAIIAISSGTREDLVHHFGVAPSRITVLPPAVDPCFARPSTPADQRAARERHSLPDRYVIVVGTLEPRKNQRLAIAALAEPAARDLALVLVGRDGGSAASLHEVARRLGVDARVHLLTNVGPRDLPSLVAGARVASYLSEAEGFGMPIVEAQAAGVPVVATRGGNLEDAGGDAARYVARDDPAALALAWQELSQDGGTRERAIVASRIHAAAFEGRPLAVRLLAIYDAVHAGAPLPGSVAAT